MTIEENVLNTADRITQSEHDMSLRSTVFYNKSISEIFMSAISAYQFIFNELFIYRNARTLNDIIDVFLANDQKIYTGILILAIALLVFFIDVTQ